MKHLQYIGYTVARSFFGRFPECALTGYPPRDMSSSAKVDFKELDVLYKQIENMAKDYGMYILIGTIMKGHEKYYNSAVLFTPEGNRFIYDKRALWGWDSDNFIAGNRSGIFEIDDIKIGVRICFEVRFPEYFRELYREQTTLNIKYCTVLRCVRQQ